MVEKTVTEKKIVTTTTGTEVSRSGGRGRKIPKVGKRGKIAIVLIAVLASIVLGIWYFLSGAYGLLKGPFGFPHTGGPAAQVYTVKTPATTGYLGVTIPSLIGILARQNANVPLAMVQVASDTTWLTKAAAYQAFSTSALTPDAALAKFGKGIPIVRFDNTNWTQICAAVTLAGVKGYLPIAKQDETAALKADLGAYTVGLDLTTMAQFKHTQLESYIGYSWLWGQVKNSVNNRWFLVNGDARNGDFDLAVYDKAFVFDFLDHNNTTAIVPDGSGLTVQKWIDQVFLPNYPAGTAAFGFWSETGTTNGTTQRGFGLGEVKTQDLISPLGIGFEASGRLNNKCLNCGLPAFSPPAQIPAPALTDDGSTCFVCFSIWNADAWGYVGENNWNCLNTINPKTSKPYSAEFPMTCGINLSSLTMMPHVAKAYWDLQAASNGNLYLIGGPSGVIYEHIDSIPTSYQPTFWKEVANFLSIAKIEYMQFLDDLPTPPAGFNKGINSTTIGNILNLTNPLPVLETIGFNGPLKGLVTWNVGASPWHIEVNGIPAFATNGPSWLPSKVTWGANVSPATTAEVTNWAKNVQTLYQGGQRFIHLIVNLPMVDTVTGKDVTYVFAEALIAKIKTMGINAQPVRMDTFVDLAKAAGAL